MRLRPRQRGTVRGPVGPRARPAPSLPAGRGRWTGAASCRAWSRFASQHAVARIEVGLPGDLLHGAFEVASKNGGILVSIAIGVELVFDRRHDLGRGVSAQFGLAPRFRFGWVFVIPRE